MNNLSLSVAEVIILQFGAIVLGFVTYYFLYGRSRRKYHFDETTERSSEVDLNFKYLHELEMKDKEIMKLNEKLKNTEEDIDIYEIELEERSKELKSLRSQRDSTSANDSTQLNEELRKLKGQVETAGSENKNLQTEIENLLSEIKNLKGERSATSKSITLSQIDELNFLRKQLAEANETNEIYQIEINELRNEIKSLRSNFESVSKGQAAGTAGKTETYYEQLQLAQQGLKLENERIGRLLEQIDIIKEKEEKERELLSKNETLILELEQPDQGNVVKTG
jgi:chromosome segregation ATPase